METVEPQGKVLEGGNAKRQRAVSQGMESKVAKSRKYITEMRVELSLDSIISLQHFQGSFCRITK